MNAPRHIFLRHSRVTPTYMEDYAEGLAQLSERLHLQVQKFAEEKERLLYSVYDRGFEDGYAAAMLEQDKGKE